MGGRLRSAGCAGFCMMLCGIFIFQLASCARKDMAAQMIAKMDAAPQ
jgi:hypothetical protein